MTDEPLNPPVNTVNMTGIFTKWLEKIKDQTAKEAIYYRIDRAKYGNFGNVRSLHGGVFEMKIDVGQGYRAYYAQEGDTIYLLLCGGNKSTQQADIAKAQAMWKAFKMQAK